MAAPRIADFKQVLAVEGYSDLLFYAEVLEHLGWADRVFIQSFNGKSELEHKLETLISPGFLAEKTHVGVIVDADADGAHAAQKFEGLLHRITGAPVQNGAWATGAAKIGLMVVPGGGQGGEIETLVWDCWAAEPKNAQAKACVETFTVCMATNAGIKAHSPAKGLVSALLAIQNDEDPRLGPGARRDIFDLGQPGFEALRTFLAGFKS